MYQESVLASKTKVPKKYQKSTTAGSTKKLQVTKNWPAGSKMINPINTRISSTSSIT
eukprot:SAG11_NODE_23129_length_394_cov_1.532203_2_plen_56_part_01